MSRKRLLSQPIEEYSLTDDERAELQRIVKKIIERPVTGQLVISLGQGAVSAVKLTEPAKTTE